MKPFYGFPFLYLILAPCLCNIGTSKRKHDELKDVSHKLNVIHYDCSEMENNKMYALNQVAPCKVNPENTEISDVDVTVYQRSYRTYVTAVMCRVKAQTSRWNCGMYSHSSMVHNQPMITTPVILTPKQCENAQETGEIRVSVGGYNFDVAITMDKTTISYKNKVSGVSIESGSSTDCDSRGQIKHYSFETFMQNVELKVNTKDNSVFSYQDLTLPCSLAEGGCDSTSLDPHAYTWNIPKNCVLIKRFTQRGTMIKNTNDPDPAQYFIVSEQNLSPEYPHGTDHHSYREMDIKIRVLNEKVQICGKEDMLYKTNFESLFVTYVNGFNMDTGKKIGKNSAAYHKMQIGTDNKVRVYGYTHKPSKLMNPNVKSNVPWEHAGEDELDYELHLGVKLDYIMYHGYTKMKQSWYNLILNQCELERTQKQTIIMLAFQNNRLAGYMLTGNRSMFLDTDGSIGWLYHCPKRVSPLKVLAKCYDRIPIFYKDKTMFVDSITRQTYPFANEVSCVEGYQNAYQLDLDVKDSWYHLLPNPVPIKAPLLFSPSTIAQFSSFPSYESQRAGIYTPNQLQSYWDRILQNSATNSVLKKISQVVLASREIDYSQSDIYSSAMGINNQVYLDSLLSPDFFIKQFKGTFGMIAYYLEKLGIYFACFLCIEFIIKLIVTILKAFEIHRISQNTVGFWKLLLGATYNLFILSIFTSIFSNIDPDEPPTAPTSRLIRKDTENFYQEHTTTCNDQLEVEEPPQKPLYPRIQNDSNVVAPP